jgi:hypothetical protein
MKFTYLLFAPAPGAQRRTHHHNNHRIDEPIRTSPPRRPFV